MLGLEDQFQNDTRIKALYRRYKNRHYNKEEKSRRIGLHASEIDHSFLADEFQTHELSIGSSGEVNLDSFHEIGQHYAISIR